METLVKKNNGKASAKELAGVTTKTATRAKTTTPKAAAPKETAAKPVEVKKPELSLDQRIEKIENLKTLIDKREKLDMSRRKLNAFVVGANQFSENIVLTDEHGHTFKTSNTEVFMKVVAVINETLVGKITEIENQISF